jgi:hypothetical protein
MNVGSRLILAAGVLVATGSASAAQPVTTANFTRAETDWVMGIQAKTGCFARLCTLTGPAALDQQQVIRMNRDTPYSRGVFDLTSPVTISLPEAGGRFQSLQVARSQFGQLFGETDDRNRVAGIFFECGIDDNNHVTGLEQFVSDGFQQDLGHLKLPSLRIVLNGDDSDVIVFGGVLNIFLIGGDDNSKVASFLLEPREVEWPFGNQHDSCSLHRIRQF